VSYDGLKMLNGGSMPFFESDLVFGLVGAMADVVLVLDPDGRLHAATTAEGKRAMGDMSRHVDRPVDAILDAPSRSKLAARLAQLSERINAGDKAAHLWCEITHVLPEAAGTPMPVRYSIHWLAGEGRFLLLGRDQRPILELQQQLVAAQVALERDYESQREIDTRYRMLMEVTRDPILFASTETRRIVDLNAAAADLIGGARAELTGVDLANEFEGRSPGEFFEMTLAAAQSETIRPVEVQARRSLKRLSVLPRVFRAAGERLLLLRLEAASSASTTSADPLGDHLRALYAKGIDGIVFLDREGTILSASESFLNLTDSPTLGDVKGRNLSDFLARGTIDLKVLIDNATRAGHLRLYPTRLKTDFEGEIAVEISATRVSEGPQALIALVVRDATRSDALRAPAAGGESGMVNVMDLVGSTSLKDIVAETTNVVEKLCIETAVELTRNNRVAAAEMLGLSRQSLYVKLRKYGLLHRDEP
jgi:transcriptional regulator PpsR